MKAQTYSYYQELADILDPIYVPQIIYVPQTTEDIDLFDEKPGIGSLLSTSIVVNLDNQDGIDATPPSEPPGGLGSRVSTFIIIDLDNEDGIDETLSKPPGLGSCMMTTSRFFDVF